MMWCVGRRLSSRSWIAQCQFCMYLFVVVSLFVCFFVVLCHLWYCSVIVSLSRPDDNNLCRDSASHYQTKDKLCLDDMSSWKVLSPEEQKAVVATRKRDKERHAAYKRQRDHLQSLYDGMGGMLMVCGAVLLFANSND